MPLYGKCVFCRIDLNSPIDEKTGQPQLSSRIIAHAQTVLELSCMGAKVVLLAHQGRKGDKDFTSLEFHAKLLEQQVQKLALENSKKAPKILFVDDVCGEKAKSAIKAMKEGDVILLENVRYLDDETEYGKNGGKSQLVLNLSQFCEAFVLDAFSCAHRAHASVVGFSSVPCLAGRVMEKELNALLKFKNPQKPVVFVLGGAKPEDSLPILASWLEAGKLDYALCGGVLGNLMLFASGIKLGAFEEFLAKKGALEHLESAKSLLLKYSSQIMLPSDLVVEENGAAKTISTSQLPTSCMIMDIGPQTALRFCSIISSASSIIMNGPVGVYEKDEYSSGTRQVLQAIAASKGFSLLGGGHTLSAIDKFSLSHSSFGYVSLSGKALIEYLSGQSLPGVELLYGWAAKRAGEKGKAKRKEKGKKKAKKAKNPRNKPKIAGKKAGKRQQKKRREKKNRKNAKRKKRKK